MEKYCDIKKRILEHAKKDEKISGAFAAMEGFEYPAQAKNCAKSYLGI